MGQQLKQSTAYNIPFFMIDATDSITGKTGLSTTVTLSKNGAAFGSAGGSVTEIGSGWYYLAANTTDTGTLGSLLLHATATGADPWDEAHQVLVDIPGGSVSSVTGSVGSVTGAVGSVTGNVGGNVVGSVGSVVATVAANLTQILGTALTETAGLLAGGFKKFFNISSPTGTLNSIPDAVAGTTNGLFIAGTNAATTVTTALTTTFTGNLTGSVGSVTGLTASNLDTTVSSRVSTTHFDTILGTPVVSISADIAEVEAETDGIAAIPTNPLLTTDVRLDNLDTTVSSRLSTAHFDTIIGTPENATVSADIAEIDEDVDNIETLLINPPTSPQSIRVITYSPPPKKC